MSVSIALALALAPLPQTWPSAHGPGIQPARGVQQLGEGAECPPGWLPTFGRGLGGTNGTVNALSVVDRAVTPGGPAPALVVAGVFSTGSSNNVTDIGLWDGVNWTALGSGMNQTIRSVAVLDDGSESAPRIFAGGAFTQAGGVSASRVAEWNGSGWAPLAGGLDGEVHALAVFDDGSGAALYAGGEFEHADGAPAYRVARWDGSSWSALGSGVDGITATVAVNALAVHDDGSGPALYAGGIFSVAGGVEAKNVARWDGSSWSALGPGRNGRVFALTAYDDGSGSALFAGGRSFDGVDAERLGKWNGSTWTPLGSGVNDDVLCLIVCEAGGSPALYAGGDFTSAGGAVASFIASWNGVSWAPLASGTSDNVNALAVFDDATERGPVLIAGGFFRDAGSVRVNGLGEWNGSRWSSGRALNSSVEALTTFDDGSGRGTALYAGGAFLHAGGHSSEGIARWDGISWEPLGSGMNSTVYALLPFDDGSGAGPKLYAGGHFTQAGGGEAWHIARWNGSAWSQVGALAGWSVTSLVAFDDGSGAGPRLHAGVNGTQTNSRVSRWNGSSWTTLGGLMSNSVLDLAVFDDGQGGGPALYAAGGFQFAGGALVNGIARWNGSSWSDVGGGMPSSSVEALAIYDDGSGPALYAGGYFPSAGGVAVSHIAKWDGASWSALGTGLDNRVTSLEVFDDGSGAGPVLIVAGEFTSAGGVATVGMATWDGQGWSSFGDGAGPTFVRALRVFDDGSGAGPALFAGGRSVTSPSGDSFLARWQGCPDTSAPELSCPSSVVVLDPLSGPPGEIVTFSVAFSDRDPDASVVCVPPSGSFFPRGTTLVSCTATDASGNQSTCEFPVTVQPKARRR